MGPARTGRRDDGGRMDTLADLITTAAERYGPRVALTLARESSSDSWTYGDLYRYVRRVAQMLQARDITPGERVVIWAPNGPRWVGAFFGCVLAGVGGVSPDLERTR